MSITAVVVAGIRAGCVDTLTPVGGVPMLVRAVHGLLATGMVEDVVVLAEEVRRGPVLTACAGLPVRIHDGARHAQFPFWPHAGQRAGTRSADGAVAAGSDLVLLHDAARPLAPTELAVAVVEAVRSGHDVAVPVLPVPDTVKQVDADGVVRGGSDRDTLRIVQTPQAFLRTVLLDTAPAAHPLDAAVAHAARGGAVRAVTGHPLAFAVHTAWDLELAGLLVTGGGT